MASWADVAKGGLPRSTGREKSSMANKKRPQSSLQVTDAGIIKSTIPSTSQLVAVPIIPARPNALTTMSTPPPPIISSSTESTTQKIPSPDTSSVTTVSTRTSTDQSSPPRNQSTPGEVTWEYAIYAAPFIPAAWRAINTEEPARTIITRNRRRIEFSAYATTFAGTTFLANQAELSRDVGPKSSPSTDLTPSSYLTYFTSLWRLECAALTREMDNHSLFKALLLPSATPLEDPIWALSIPGLRDDSPFLEMGDVLQLRQLRLDGKGDISLVPMVVEEPEYVPGFSRYRSGWTGTQFNACIHAINRATEMVYLEIEGLRPLYVGYHQVPTVANVTFPMKHVRLQVRQKALLIISSELEALGSQANPLESQFDDEEEFDHFNRTVKSTKRTQTVTNGNTNKNDWVRRMLFPTEEDGLMQTRLRKVPHRDLFDSAINYEQAHAIKSIFMNDYGTLPYLISGPPGTGKTKTLVETAMQLFYTSKVAHTLICAPSEAAADTLALRLKQYLGKDQLLRLIRPGRADNEVPSKLTQYCYMEENMFTLPPIKAMMKYNVVVTSCQDAGILLEARLTNNELWNLEKDMFTTFHPQDKASIPTLHWGALIIDEAAQATELDLLPAVRVACPPSTYPSSKPQPLFVMAGDENQLGPRTASRDPLFSKSLFARLSERPLYKDHPLSRSHSRPSAGPPVLKKNMLPILCPPFTNLIRNYRSHPAILSVPSSLFYHDTLIPEALTPNTPLQFPSLWRGRKWPVLFIPNTRPDEIERDGGGWYNLAEAHAACDVARNLVEHSSVKQADICIMSPFAAQVRLLRSLIRSSRFGGGSGLWNVNIGPLEAFQGLEKRVVIICTTRTREFFLEEDKRRGLGIVHARRKMNVALTRAKEGLVVIGNPAILMQDENWKEWLGFCWRNGLMGGDGQEGGLELWKAEFEKQKIGVLERALIAKEESGGMKGGKTLGGAAKTLDMDREYEVWMEKLREVMDEDEDEDEEDYEEDESNVEEDDEGAS